LVKVRVTKVARSRSASVADWARRQKGELSVIGTVYLPGRQRKKKAMQSILMTVRASGVPC
jgi:hypothetical protein